MDIFNGWDNYTERLTYNWNLNVTSDDTIVLPGDFSWAMNFDEAKADFDYLNKLNGRKILLKGNHDYWWTTLSKMNRFLSENNFDTISILHNNHFQYEQYGICGTRGWINENGNTADAKVLAREAQRLEVSIKSALNAGLVPIVFLHYPPVYADNCNYNILDILFRYNIKECYYGHIHGKSCDYAINGERDGITYRLVSSDYAQFSPVKIK
jgi:predicted phosphohydrolase